MTEQCLRVGALLGWRFSIAHVATMLGVDEDQVRTVLLAQPHLVEVDEDDNDSVVFNYVLHQLRLMEDTIQQLPQIADQWLIIFMRLLVEQDQNCCFKPVRYTIV